MTERYFGRCRYCTAWTVWNVTVAVIGAVVLCYGVDSHSWLLAGISGYVLLSSASDAQMIWEDCGRASHKQEAP